MIPAIILYIGILFSFLQGWLLIAAAMVLVFSVRYNTVVLIPLAILLDGYFNRFAEIPWLSVGMVLWFVLAEQIRPLLLSVNNKV